jgi:hypothetical protein
VHLRGRKGAKHQDKLSDHSCVTFDKHLDVLAQADFT